MEFLYLTDSKGNEIQHPDFVQIKNAYLEVFRSKSYSRSNFISIVLSGEEKELEIYPQSIVLIDHLLFYEGPGGPAELLSVRYQEGTILPVLEEAINLFQGGEMEKLIKLLKTLPKPKD